MNIYDSLFKYIDWPYLAVFMCMTYFLSQWLLSVLQYIFSRNLRMRLIIFIIGTAAAAPFWIWFDHDPVNLLVTWSAGLALHDYFIKLIIEAFKSLRSRFKEGGQ